MITVSICMIVKNEENVIARCLNCLREIADEIIIVDTGSTDQTKEIAGNYTNNIYDFVWTDDFSEARNFSFSKASMDYIYCADADEIIDEANIECFLQLKQVLLPEIELVQMKYCNQLEFGTTYNFDVEYRPKLYKRVREFVWIDPLHESVRLQPIVYDSEIEVIHKPDRCHGSRDFSLIQKILKQKGNISNKLSNMYAKELFIVGEKSDFLEAEPFFAEVFVNTNHSVDEILDATCVVARAARLRGDIPQFFKAVTKCLAVEACSEICYELGEYYYHSGDKQEAALWYANASSETEARLDLRCKDSLPKKRLNEI